MSRYYVTIPALLRVEFDAESQEDADAKIEDGDLLQTLDSAGVDIMETEGAFSAGRFTIYPLPVYDGSGYDFEDGPLPMEEETP